MRKKWKLLDWTRQSPDLKPTAFRLELKKKQTNTKTSKKNSNKLRYKPQHTQ